MISCNQGSGLAIPDAFHADEEGYSIDELLTLPLFIKGIERPGLGENLFVLLDLCLIIESRLRSVLVPNRGAVFRDKCLVLILKFTEVAQVQTYRMRLREMKGGLLIMR